MMRNMKKANGRIAIRIYFLSAAIEEK